MKKYTSQYPPSKLCNFDLDSFDYEKNYFSPISFLKFSKFFIHSISIFCQQAGHNLFARGRKLGKGKKGKPLMWLEQTSYIINLCPHLDNGI